MPLLQVRNCPEDLYRRVSQSAKQENRTIAQQVIVLLSKGLGQEESNIERRRRVLERINRRKIPQQLREADVVSLIREDRDR